ncbi:HSP20-like chaperone [Cladochytrium replicatum]|nr:HSP20-like chaperone [Cladochytrium replicatum]
MDSRVWEPFSLFDRDPFFRDFDNYVRHHVDAVFSDAYKPSTRQIANTPSAENQVTKTEQLQPRDQWMRSPRMDVSETDSEYLIRADLPGLKKEDVNIQLRNDILTIEGERKDERSGEKEGGKVHFYERSFGKFSRQLKLPVDVDLEKAGATMENGVLELRLGKKVEEKPAAKQITIQ